MIVLGVSGKIEKATEPSISKKDSALFANADFKRI
jgi:hypothetical protein